MKPEPGTPASNDELQREVERLRLLHAITQDFNSSLDLDELLPRVFNTVLDAVGAQAGSLWLADGDVLRCQLALGSASEKLVGTEMPVGSGFVGDVARKQRTTLVTDAPSDDRFDDRVDRSSTMIAANVMATAMVAKGVTVGAIQVANKISDGEIFDERDRELLEALATSAAIALRNAQLLAEEKRASDLAVLHEISREITSTLDLDRVLRSVVNLSSRALTFDQAAVSLYERGRFEVRAVAGEDQIDARSDRTKRLAARAAWAAERGETFALWDRAAPASDIDRAFVSAFGGDLEEDGLASGLYVPIQDEEGVLGALVFEGRQAGFPGATQRELGEILANQTAVAVRNAQLYSSVPLADALGTIAAKKRALLAVPRRKRITYAAVAVTGLLAVTLIQWPLRVTGRSPTFRAAAYAEVRTLVPGVLERMHAREGMEVARGSPLAAVRRAEIQAERAAVVAEADVAERIAAAAAAQGNPTTERLHRGRAAALREEVVLLDELIARTTLRAPMDGVVLTPRTEELVGTHVDAGDLVVTLGRVDTLELEFGIRQHDLTRISLGQRVRLRVDALPQRTFEGRVSFLGTLPSDTTVGVWFPIRASVPNPDGRLRPGMVAHVKILTAPMSVAGRAVRAPLRWIRLSWWRVRS